MKFMTLQIKENKKIEAVLWAASMRFYQKEDLIVLVNINMESSLNSPSSVASENF